MKLVHVHSRTVVDLADGSLPPYALLSHTRDAAADQKPSRQKNGSVGPDANPPHYAPNPGSPPSYTSDTTTTSGRRPPKRAPPALRPGDKFEQACEHARRTGFDYIWIADLCIDKTSTADLDDAVNGSRRRLRNAALCLAYLHDLPVTTADGSGGDDLLSAWGRCRYWRRAWTLQELVLAPRVRFYDGQWNYRGDKDSPALAPLLARITGIPRRVLIDSSALADVALAVRIAWSARRAAAREEDTAYALVALTEATLPVRYGEGAARAFLRLQEELLRDTRDGSLLAWRSAREGEVRGLLARSPAEFGHFAPTNTTTTKEEPQRPWVFNGKVRFSSKGIELESRVCKGPGCMLLSIGQKRQDVGTGSIIAIGFREWNGVYVRVTAASRVSAAALRSWRSIDVMRDVDACDAVSLRSLFDRLPCHIETARRQGCYEEAGREGFVPRVAHDSEEGARQQRFDEDKDHDTDMGVDKDEAALTRQRSDKPPSNHSEDSYVYIAMTGSWVGSQEEYQQQSASDSDDYKKQQQDSNDYDKQQPAAHPHDDEMCSNAAGEDDAVFSDDSDPGSLTSHGASAGVTESDWGEDDQQRLDSNGHDNFNLARAYSGEADDDADAMATKTCSTTTLAAETDSGSKFQKLAWQDAVQAHIKQTSLERALVWICQAKYEELPGDRLTPLSRIVKKNRRAPPPETVTAAATNESGAQPTADRLPLDQPAGYFHFSCPFYAADPEMHRSCVLEGRDLKDICAVFKHIREHHGCQPYCPRCHLDFTDLEVRDHHLQLGACTPVGHLAPRDNAARKGVSEITLARIEATDVHYSRRDEGEARRWRRIYWALFPGLWPGGGPIPQGRHIADGDAFCDPYLRSGNGLAVSKLHDFWAERWEECVAAGFEAAGHDWYNPSAEMNPTNEEVDGLYWEILAWLVEKVYWECPPSGQKQT